MEGDESFQDVQDCLQSGQDMPFEVAGTVLKPHQLIQDVNVADGEPLILEWKIALEADA